MHCGPIVIAASVRSYFQKSYCKSLIAQSHTKREPFGDITEIDNTCCLLVGLKGNHSAAKSAVYVSLLSAAYVSKFIADNCIEGGEKRCNF